MTEDPDNLKSSSTDEFEKILCNVEMLVDKELHNT